eukprot:gene11050-biopygen7817
MVAAAAMLHVVVAVVVVCLVVVVWARGLVWQATIRPPNNGKLFQDLGTGGWCQATIQPLKNGQFVFRMLALGAGEIWALGAGAKLILFLMVCHNATFLVLPAAKTAAAVAATTRCCRLPPPPPAAGVAHWGLVWQTTIRPPNNGYFPRAEDVGLALAAGRRRQSAAQMKNATPCGSSIVGVQTAHGNK